MIAVGSCWACGRTFTFNVDRVPSIIVAGSREPLCRPCVERANELRLGTGSQEIVVYPDSYGPSE
jgi:hypothetical protein